MIETLKDKVNKQVDRTDNLKLKIRSLSLSKSTSIDCQVYVLKQKIDSLHILTHSGIKNELFCYKP